MRYDSFIIQKIIKDSVLIICCLLRNSMRL